MGLIKRIYGFFGFIAAFMIILVGCGIAGVNLRTAFVADVIIIVLGGILVFSILRRRSRKAEAEKV
ncbi:hypothetical protein [Parasporobacterium paucivorans]|uniref:Uncharacterized protein n=1 Tax=Parasporobacterium paucivorans DSM 15970 TaxID=1122934 RepID=A0A1M6GYV3_9FIRM|nr:hypothetical protein [Parasporobacterium paucivorans]SHJ15107.1 hypothetical protein SAMN02745691_01433 [Parasporobacterium paucivorans DSM 15970]